MLNKAVLCVGALVLTLIASALSVGAQDAEPKPEEPKAETEGAIKRSDVPDKYKEVEKPLLSDEERIAAGKKAYASSCAKCHGDEGKGDGKMAEKMDPKPTDLTSAEFQDNVSDHYIYWRIKRGDEGYAGEGKSKMRGLTAAGDGRLWELTAFVRSLKTEPVVTLSKDEFKTAMKGIKANVNKVKVATKDKDKDAATKAGDELAAHAARIKGYDGDAGDGSKVRDKADFKQFAGALNTGVADYLKAVKAEDWDKAGEAQNAIGESCGSCHDVYKK